MTSILLLCLFEAKAENSRGLSTNEYALRLEPRAFRLYSIRIYLDNPPGPACGSILRTSSKMAIFSRLLPHQGHTRLQ